MICMYVGDKRQSTGLAKGKVNHNREIATVNTCIHVFI